jgi:hypothetical protein
MRQRQRDDLRALCDSDAGRYRHELHKRLAERQRSNERQQVDIHPERDQHRHEHQDLDELVENS